jgi:hypothetical protein
MFLIAEEYDLVLEKNLVDRADRLVGEVTRQLDVPDLRAEAGGALDDIGSRNDVIDVNGLSHDRVSQGCDPCQTMLRHASVAGTTAEMNDVIFGLSSASVVRQLRFAGRRLHLGHH